MGATRNLGFLENIIQYDPNGNVSVVSGSTTLLYISSSGAIATTGSSVSGSSAFLGNVAITGSLSVSGSAVNLNGLVTVTGSQTAVGAIARSVNITSSLVAAANSDVLVGLDINPTFTNGAFTGISNIGIRSQVTSATGAWNLYVSGSANNYIAGGLLIGTTNIAGYKLDVNGTVRFVSSSYFATNTGNVGIGTTNPYYKLEVFGTVRFTSSSYFATNNTANVGIGTTNPSVKLDVSGSATISGSIIATGDITGSAALFTSTITAQTLVVQTITASQEYSSGSNVFGNALTNTQVMTGSLQVTGSNPSYFLGANVGVGTTGPAVRFHAVGLAGGAVPGATGIPSLGFANSSSIALFTNNDPNYGILFGTLNTGVGWIQQQRVDGTGTAYNLVLQPNAGSVGIGAVNPQTKLHISASNDRASIRLENSAASKVWEILPSLSGVANAGFSIYNVTDNKTPFYITDAGNVGIGTTNPGAKLEVSGTGYFSTGSYAGSLGKVTINTSTATLGATQELGLLISNDGSTGKLAQIGFGYSESRTGAVIGGIISNGAGATTSDLFFATRTTTVGSDAPTERMRITSAGNVGIGTSATNFFLDVWGSGGDQSGAGQTLQVKSTNGTVGQGTGIRISAVSGSKETVGIVSMENTSGINGDMVFRLYEGGATMNEKVRITNAGVLSLTIGQIKFPATQNASSDANTLDDYEEGSWTPIIGGSTSESGQSYSTQRGRYVKIGSCVTVTYDVALSTKGTITGNAVLKGLPFSRNTDASYNYPRGTVGWESTVTSFYNVQAEVQASGYAELKGLTAATTNFGTALVTADLGNSSRFFGFITYFV